MKKEHRFMFMVAAMLCIALPLFAGGQKPAAVSSALSEIGFNATGYPIVSKPFTFSMVVSKSPLNGSFPQMTSLINMEKKTGVTVNYIEVPSQSFNERKNLILASDDLPDVFWSSVTDADTMRYGQLGTFIPLEGMIDQYGVNLKNLFTKRPDVKKYVTTPMGHIYNLPQINELAHRITPDNMFINKTWLNKLGLRVPTTYDEFYNVLKAFKEQDPNGNGLRDELPFSFIGNSVGNDLDMISLFAGFGMHDNFEHLMVSNKKVYFTANSPEFRNALVYFNKLYSEGLIDPEAFTHNQREYFAKGNAPVMAYGAFIAWWDENVVGTERAVNDYICLPPLTVPGGKQRWNMRPEYVLSRGRFSITNAMKYPEVGLRWADLCYDWATSLELGFGTWDIVIKLDGDKIILLDPPAGKTQEEHRQNHAPVNAAGWVVMEADIRKMNLTPNHIRKLGYLDIYRPFLPALDEIYPRVFFLPDEEAELSIIRTDIINYVNQMRAKFIVGSESISSGWNNYVQQLNQMGLNRYVELHQKALDRY